jgi:hypothetical protein
MARTGTTAAATAAATGTPCWILGAAFHAIGNSNLKLRLDRGAMGAAVLEIVPLLFR